MRTLKKAALLLVLACVGTSELVAEQYCDNAEKLIKQFDVVMKQENNYRKVYVNKYWQEMTLETKENVTRMIAKCLQKQEAVDVIDGYSGKKLASWGPFQKFKVEQ